jgi:histidinol-phosphatase (PHP family)
MTILSDFHIHPSYSIDGAGTIRQYCDRAIELGIRHICFTTHYDSNPSRVEQDGYWHDNGARVRMSDSLLEKYLSEIEKAQVFFAEFGLSIYKGLEIDYFPGVEKEAERVKANFPLDFVIGSVHCLEDVGISDKNEAPAYFNHKTLDQMIDDTIALQIGAAECRLFDTIAHLDYYVRYSRQYYGDSIDLVEPARFDPLFKVLLRNNVGIEINTSPYRYGKSGFHPAERILERAISQGVVISSVGSDSHKPANLGLGIADAFAFLERHNIAPLFPRINEKTAPSIL